MLTLTVGDTGTGATLTGTCNATITGATLEVHVKRPDGTAFSRDAAIVSGPAGTWSCALQAGDLTVAGDYFTEVEVTYSGGAVQTFALDTSNRPVFFRVRDEYA